MVTYYVKLNETYTITATDECNVYNASGVLIATCPANSSINVKAATAKLKLSDDNAAIKKAVSASGGGTSAECEEHIANGDIHTTAAEKTKIANAVQLHGVNNFTAFTSFAGNVEVNGGLSVQNQAPLLRVGVNVLPLGTKTALGADAYGLHVSASGGLQLFGTHFLLGDIFSDNSLKIASNNLSMYSTDEAAISFDYANKSIFRSMPNDGTEGTYEFQCWQWADDSHTSKKEAGVKLLKASQVSALENHSVMNKFECDTQYARLNSNNSFNHTQYFNGAIQVSSGTFNGEIYKKGASTFSDTSVLNKSENDTLYVPKNYGTANAILITDSTGKITVSNVISIAELNTLNNNVTNIATKLADLESRLAALES